MRRAFLNGAFSGCWLLFGGFQRAPAHSISYRKHPPRYMKMADSGNVAVMEARYLGGLNLNRMTASEAHDMAQSLFTALKLGFAIEASIPNPKDGQKLDYWTPLIQFRAVPPQTPKRESENG
jgi:hypothetical protein